MPRSFMGVRLRLISTKNKKGRKVHMKNDPQLQLPLEAKPSEPKEPLAPIDLFDEIDCSMSYQEFDRWLLQLEQEKNDAWFAS
jgi:hypothetical protein